MNHHLLTDSREKLPLEQTHELDATATMLKSRSVLILEDDVALGIMLKESLQAQNYLVTVVPSGAEGLKQILANDFDVILCDMVMPNFPGDMFYLAVERARPYLCKRFIFMTGHQGDRKIEQFIRRIRGLMLWKPFELHVLFEAMQVITRKHA
jgi:CheY-like chemotaxis protein